MFYLGFALSLLSTALYILGAVAVTGILIYGVYAFFTRFDDWGVDRKCNLRLAEAGGPYSNQ